MRDVNALDPLKIQDLLFRKLADLAGEPRFRGEIARAEREFFGASPGADPTAGSNAARFSEWYLLERESEALGDVPVQGGKGRMTDNGTNPWIGAGRSAMSRLNSDR